MPKERYRIMRNYMPTKGSLGLDMMFRSTTIQASHAACPGLVCSMLCISGNDAGVADGAATALQLCSHGDGQMVVLLSLRGAVPRSLPPRALQVNLDFESEQDMIEKMRVGLALQPIATALFANSPFRNGKDSGYLSWRQHVWQDTDPDRCGNLPFVFDQDFTFERCVGGCVSPKQRRTLLRPAAPGPALTAAACPPAATSITP